LYVFKSTIINPQRQGRVDLESSPHLFLFIVGELKDGCLSAGQLKYLSERNAASLVLPKYIQDRLKIFKVPYR